jgi:hypothetical protein
MMWYYNCSKTSNEGAEGVCRLPFEERAAVAQNAAGKRLLELMARKRTNLAVAADVATVEEMLRIADAAGPHIAVFKTHVDIFDKWDDSIAAQLRQLADKHGGAAPQICEAAEILDMLTRFLVSVVDPACVTAQTSWCLRTGSLLTSATQWCPSMVGASTE